MINAMSRIRDTAKMLTAMPRIQDFLEAKLYELLQAHQQGHVYLTGPGQAHRDCQALDKLFDMNLVDFRRSERAGVRRWYITIAGRSYFERNEQHHPPPPIVEPRSSTLIARVLASKERGEVFTTSPGSYYEDEMLELKRRGYLRSRMIMKGKKAGRLSWTITEAGMDFHQGLSVLR